MRSSWSSSSVPGSSVGWSSTSLSGRGCCRFAGSKNVSLIWCATSNHGDISLLAPNPVQSSRSISSPLKCRARSAAWISSLNVLSICGSRAMALTAGSNLASCVDASNLERGSHVFSTQYRSGPAYWASYVDIKYFKACQSLLFPSETHNPS